MTVAAQTELEIFERIVCGVDGTTESLEAARQAERLRMPAGTLRLATVAEIDIAVHGGWAMSHLLEEIDASARAALHHAIDEVHPESTQLLAGDVTARLLDEIEQANATLLALGPRGRSRAIGMLVGGVATELLHRAPCSVLFARRPRFGGFPLRVVAGVDGSESSLAAAAVAKAIADRFRSEYTIVAATGGKPIHREPVENLSPYFAIDPGHPVEVLSELSKSADLVVVGSRGVHGPRALGSVSERVAHRAACSVLVVRNPEEES